jgi:transposase
MLPVRTLKNRHICNVSNENEEQAMAYNFMCGDRNQPFLLPPDLRDWLPDDHLAWFILDVVDQLDLGVFYQAHRADGHGHPAYDPKTLLGILLYGYSGEPQMERQSVR